MTALRNQFRSQAFIKIKQNIHRAENALHLQTCRAMIENCTPTCTKDEITILKEYLSEAQVKYESVGESFADEMDSIKHKRLAAQ